MICISKKILCYILIGFLTFSVTSTVYYKSVHAMEWVGGALAFEEALKWLLAAIGITATAGMTDAYWDTYGDDFVDYAIENGATQTEVAEWQLKACQGIIDKGSVVWSKFKAWASTLINGNGSSSGETTSFYDVCTFLENQFNVSLVNRTGFENYTSYEISAFAKNTNGYLYLVQYDYVPYINTSNNLILNNHRVIYTNISSSSDSWTSTTGYQSLQFYAGAYLSNNVVKYSNSNYNYINYEFSASGGSVADSNFESTASNVNYLDVISSDGVDEDNPEVTIPMPGVSDSDNEASKDAYQDIIDAINDGTITQEQGVEQIQDILKIVTYDTVTDKLVPPQQNEDGTDKTKDDALKENKENMGFTLGGLEAVFPFCIPFDIYAFMTLLVADPVAPEFDFPIQSVNGQVEEIHVDLEPFEPVAVVVRYCFDFLFIIGLALATRELIGAGGGD